MNNLSPVLSGNLHGYLKYGLQLLAWGLLTPLAFLLRLEGDVGTHAAGLLILTAAGVPLKAAVIGWLALHRRSWRASGVADLLALSLGVATVTAVLALIVVTLFPVLAIPRSVPLIEGPLAILVLGAMPLVRRLRHEGSGRRCATARGDARRVLIVGAGDAGQTVSREMRRHPEAGLVPVGFLDDDRQKRALTYGGVVVLGPLSDLTAAARAHRVDEVLIAMPSQPGAVVRRVVGLSRDAGVPSRTLPALHELASGRVSISAIREVDVEDLLGRAPVRLDLGPIKAYLRGQTVLVTGAGGSIGSELVRQLAGFEPAALVLLGRGENSVFEIDRELAWTHPDVRRHAIICDIRDADSLARVFERFRPGVVFHAAAHKHVPLMEANPEQAVLNNVGGTRNLVRLAIEHRVRRFVNISTDKAVRPTSVMGATKRVAEALVTEAGQRSPHGAFVSVRFGNVLGSRGSVVPSFKDQIRRGGPVVVTDPEMVRYFMTIPEAAQLVLQAGAMAMNGRVFVLDMGDPVRIVDLARDLILLSGLEPGKDIEIAFSGLRPGEKLFEELLTEEEGMEASRHEKIFVARTAPLHTNLARQLDRLFEAAGARDDGAVQSVLRDLVPDYRPPAPAPALPGGDGWGRPADAGVPHLRLTERTATRTESLATA